MTFKIRRVEAFHPGKQVILWLEDEVTHSTTMPEGGEWCVRITVPEAPAVIEQLVAAYTHSFQKAMIEVAAGGCRTCNNTRRVNRALIDLDGMTGEPCPVCIPRADERIRKSMSVRRPQDSAHTDV